MSVARFFWQLTGSSFHDPIKQLETAAVEVFATLALWQERGRQRRALEKLDPALLQDIGRSQQEVTQECAKPVWRA